MAQVHRFSVSEWGWQPTHVFWGVLGARLLLLVSLPWEGVLAYGDLLHYYHLAALPGWPMVDYWVEYPPLFPWLAEGLYRLVAGNQVAFIYILALLFSGFQAATLALLWRAFQEASPREAPMRLATLAILMVPLFYGWAYMDAAVVWTMLAAWHAWRNQRAYRAGLWLAAGALLKWFPLLMLPLWWRQPNRTTRIATLTALATILGIWAAAAFPSPTMARASLLSQLRKGSWETCWALLDGNLRTGLFGPLQERMAPATALRSRGNPARISPWLTLLPFLGLGLWCWRRYQGGHPGREAAFIGLTWVLFVLWSPGYSVQWILYLLPWIFLALPRREATLLATALVAVHILEWPVLLSRGLWAGLWLVIPLRTLLLGFAGVLLGQVSLSA